MKATSLLEICLLQTSDFNRLSFFLKQHGTHHYQLDRLFYWEKVNEYVAGLVYDFSLQNDVWVVKEGKDIKGLMGFRRRKWDSEYFGYPVASIDYFFVGRGTENSIISLLLMARFDEWKRKHAIKFVFIKVFPNSNLTKVLEKNGFYYVGNEFTLSRSLSFADLKEKPDSRIRFLRKNDISELLRIVKNVSWIGRFHADSNIGKKEADQLYVHWLSNGTKRDDAKVTVLEVDSKPAGFILWSIQDLCHGDKTFIVGDQELVAIDPKFRGKGYGKILYRETLRQMQKAGVGLVKTNIAAQNAPALNNQASIGFGFNYNVSIFHKFF